MKWIYFQVVFSLYMAIPLNQGVHITATGFQIKVINLSRQLLLCRELIGLRNEKCKNILEKEIRKLKVSLFEVGAKRNALTAAQNLNTDRTNIHLSGKYVSDVYPIWLKVGYRFIDIYCDMESGSYITNKTGWITFQQRKNGKINFNRGWEDYVNGFGNPNEDYWAGLENILMLTNQNLIVLNHGYSTLRPNLRVDLKGWDGFNAHVEYERFTLYSNRNYKIGRFGKRYGTGFQPNFPDAFFRQEFSTFDKKSEGTSFQTNCPGPHNSGWWFSECGFSNLNGVYQGPNQKMSKRDGIYWRHWFLINTNKTALKHASMKTQYPFRGN
uniref:Self-incompatibility-linked fibrinogen-like protein-B n=1 Tax=Ciona intestinalis TaxID=7719 RepID=A0A143RFG2_CIOIN|nr:self-incompatibility-linked fibrinogen-like protein-B [Ciona intestinalis]